MITRIMFETPMIPMLSLITDTSARTDESDVSECWIASFQQTVIFRNQTNMSSAGSLGEGELVTEKISPVAE